MAKLYKRKKALDALREMKKFGRHSRAGYAWLGGKTVRKK